MRCTLENEGISARIRQLARLLNPLAPPSRRLAFYPRYLKREVVLIAYIGEQPTSPDPDEWRFPTRISNIRATYYERWIPTDERQKAFYLERAYLHLYRRDDAGVEAQIMALHCDPNEPESSKHFKYKAGPHIHVSMAEHPVRRAHLALNNANLATVLSSITELTSALRSAVTMVDDEVLDLYSRS
jgi:hypothetical protein